MRMAVALVAIVLSALVSGCARAGATSSAAGPEPPPTPASANVAPLIQTTQTRATSQSGQPGQSGSAAQQVTEITGTLSEYSILLAAESAPPGLVRFTVQNIGQRKHNLRIAGNGVDAGTRDIAPGQTGRVEVRFVDPGPYTVYCDLADHADRGMQLTFTIEA